MPEINVNADLQVLDGVVTRQLEAGSPDGDFGVETTGAASETTLAEVLVELAGKLEPADLAALASAARQDAAKAVLDGILGAVDGVSRTVDVEAVRDRLPTTLDADGSLKVADVFTAGEVLPDQSGAGAVLTFTFTTQVDLVLVRSVGGLARCDPFGGVPTASLGVRCPDDEPTYLPIRATVVKVFAPAASDVTVAGFRG